MHAISLPSNFDGALTCCAALLQANPLPEALNLLPCLSQVLLHQT
jgi:hypothetical protein